MELKLAYAAMRILYKITKYRVGRGGFNRPHNVVNGSLRSLRDDSAVSVPSVAV